MNYSVYPVTRAVLSDTTQEKPFETARRCRTTLELLVSTGTSQCHSFETPYSEIRDKTFPRNVGTPV